jgi:phage portal protein BeeE
VLHIRGFGDDPLCGLSVARLAAESLGLTMAAQTFGASFFGNGANYGTVLEHPGKLSPEARVNLRTSWKNAYGGGAERAQRRRAARGGRQGDEGHDPARGRAVPRDAHLPGP